MTEAALGLDSLADVIIVVRVNLDDDTTVILLATYVEVSVGLRMGFISGSNPGGGGIYWSLGCRPNF